MNSKVYSEPLYELHWKKTWHLHFITYLYCHLRVKCPALHHVFCWRSERSRKLLEQNLLECERHGDYRHIIFLLPFTMLKHLSLNFWLVRFGKNTAWGGEYWREKKSFWNSLGKSKYSIFLPNKKWSLKYRPSHHLHIVSPLIIKNQLCAIHAILPWTDAGYYFMNIQFWFHLCFFHLFLHKSVKLDIACPAFLLFIIFITEVSECFKHGAPCCTRCSMHN